MMEQEQAYKILMKAFSVLNAEEIENFRFHLQRETPVLVGDDAAILFTKEGYG